MPQWLEWLAKCGVFWIGKLELQHVACNRILIFPYSSFIWRIYLETYYRIIVALCWIVEWMLTVSTNFHHQCRMFTRNTPNSSSYSYCSTKSIFKHFNWHWHNPLLKVSIGWNIVTTRIPVHLHISYPRRWRQHVAHLWCHSLVHYAVTPIC